MATAFNYEAVDNAGKALLGQVSAETTREATNILLSRGLTPVHVAEIKPAKTREPLFSLRRGPSTQDYILTLKQMALLLNAGVPLISGVETLKSQSIHPHLAEAFTRLAKALRSGQEFSAAFQSTLPGMPSYVFQLSAAGEAIGELGPALADAADQLEYEYRVHQEFRNALTYPSILVAAGLTAVLFIFIVVVPRFSAMLASSSGELPLISEIVLSTGMALSENKTSAFVIVALFSLMIAWVLRKPSARNAMRQKLIFVPVLGTWLKESELARWASMLSTMLQHGVDLIRALDLARQTMSINSLQTKMEQVSKMVRTGKSISASMAEQDMFSNTALSLVQVGEESGELASMLESLAKLYEDSGRQRMKRFLLLLEPAAIILIGLVIGGIVTAIMLAITSINQVGL
ncbi:MAG: type II secretion system F family protein [Rhodospirillaceae bacterium]